MKINLRSEIKEVLWKWNNSDFFDIAINLLDILGYNSGKVLSDQTDQVEDFIQQLNVSSIDVGKLDSLRSNVKRIRFLFQFADDDVSVRDNHLANDTLQLDNQASREKSFLFVAVDLHKESYSRGQYAEITREINKIFQLAPTVVLFKTNSLSSSKLTVSTVYRREHKIKHDRKVLGRVSLIKEINPIDPHRAHLDILANLSLNNCFSIMNRQHKKLNFDSLLETWLDLLNTDQLNKNFYKELFDWYEWAVSESKFPSQGRIVLTNEENIIRLITRLLFIWFIKEKGLVAIEIFEKEKINQVLKDFDPNSGDSYYRVILQNLFFATLNTEISKRTFKALSSDLSHYKFQNEITDKETLFSYFAITPFINGGLFDCLDSKYPDSGELQLIDCFSSQYFSQLSIPNILFFDSAKGLLSILNRYKFTVEEKTPIEQEVALDPELLGKVFENLLAAYNPETQETARKNTGSYYTPNEIVDFMIGESLIEALGNKVVPVDKDLIFWKERLQYLLDYEDDYNDAEELFCDTEKEYLIKAIADLKILDPAVGSGAFLIGVLNRLILILQRLDLKNDRWKELQIQRAGARSQKAFETNEKEARDAELKMISEVFQSYKDDFGRKLFLIQNNIFGTDIQPIACQIAKLRFFISLAIDQEIDLNSDNFGIKPLPNLETRFVAADSLLKQKEEWKNMLGIGEYIRKLTANRESYFHANSHIEKNRFRQLDRQLRHEFSQIFSSGDEVDIIANWDPFDQNSKADWFDPHYMFGIENGFDIVIGNPPYRQLQKNSGELANRYSKCNFEVFAGTGDIYCLFFERGLELLKENGFLCFITSNKWLRNDYAKKLRKYLEKYKPIKLIDFGGNKIFESATVDTDILLIQKTPQSQQSQFTTNFATKIYEKLDQGENIRSYSERIPMTVKSDMGQWVICRDEEARLLSKIECVGTPLKEWHDISIYRGVLTGFNNAFILDNETKNKLVSQDPKSIEILKPVLRGRDIKRYHAEWKKLWLINTIPSLKTNIDSYPVVKQYLLSFGKERLEQAGRNLSDGTKSRKKTSHKWFELQDTCAYHALFDQEKIVNPDISSSPNFSLANKGMYVEATAFIFNSGDKCLLAILNSKVADFYISSIAPDLGKEATRYKKKYIEEFPIPEYENANIKTEMETIVLSLLKNPSSKETPFLEAKLNSLVYHLYDLNQDEINIIESS